MLQQFFLPYSLNLSEFRLFLACTLSHQKPQMTFLVIRLDSLSLM